MDSFENLMIALGSRQFYKIDIWFCGPHRSPAKTSWGIPLKRKLEGSLRHGTYLHRIFSHLPPPALGEKWIVTGESTLSWQNNWSLTLFTATLALQSTGWAPASWQDRTQTIPAGGKKSRVYILTLLRTICKVENAPRSRLQILSHVRGYEWDGFRDIVSTALFSFEL